jgi:hypothetical protein
MHDARNGGLGVDPSAPKRKPERDDDGLASHDAIGRGDEQSVVRDIDDAIGDETEIAKPNGLAGNVGRITN